ncbi:MAG: hypothetical protein GXP62_04330 [Oligoflexia bacterium]|nr:hypothetical protein [Oligoflexia bacterium]
MLWSMPGPHALRLGARAVSSVTLGVVLTSWCGAVGGGGAGAAARVRSQRGLLE